MTRVVIPPLPGLFSSLGLLFADVEHHLIQTRYMSAAYPDYDELDRVVGSLTHEAESTLDREGYDVTRRAVSILADARYQGQDYALTIPVRGERLGASQVKALVEDFHKEHQRTYGYESMDEEVQIVAVRCLAKGLPDKPVFQESSRWPPSKAGTPPSCGAAILAPTRGGSRPPW